MEIPQVGLAASSSRLNTSGSPCSVFDLRPSPASLPSTHLPSSSSSCSAAPPPPPFLLSLDSISCLPQRLRLANIPRDEADAVLRMILHSAFFFSPQRSSADNFFSYTVTEDEISLIADEDTLARFPSDALVLSPDHLRAIQVYEGAQAINMTGYVSLLSGGITQEGINVIYLSTYNTDLLLVDERKLERALELLKKTLADFNSGMKERSARPLSFPTISKQMLLSPLPNSLSLACLPIDDIPKCTHQLLRAFLGNASFFSFTISDNELSLIMDDDLLDGFPPDLLTVHSSQWRSIQVDLGSLGFTAVGGVSLLADILAREGISIYYLSTFSTDFVLVEAKQVDDTVNIVTQRSA